MVVTPSAVEVRIVVNAMLRSLPVFARGETLTRSAARYSRRSSASRHWQTSLPATTWHFLPGGPFCAPGGGPFWTCGGGGGGGARGGGGGGGGAAFRGGGGGGGALGGGGGGGATAFGGG